MDIAPISQDEAFHNSFFYFVKALNVMMLDAAAQCEAMGNFNVAWEIQHDVMDTGIALDTWTDSYLTQVEKDQITRLVALVKELPKAALESEESAVNHPDWAKLRIAAFHLLKLLAGSIEKNREFFSR